MNAQPLSKSSLAQIGLLFNSFHTAHSHITHHHVSCHSTTPPLTPSHLISYHIIFTLLHLHTHATTPPFTHHTSHQHTSTHTTMHTSLHITTHTLHYPHTLTPTHTITPLSNSFLLTSTCILRCVLKEDRSTVKMDRDSSKTAGTAEVPFLDRERQSCCLMSVRKGPPVRKTGPLF